MKTISHGKNELTSRPQKREVFFVFVPLLMSFKKSFKRLGQVHLEYLVLFAVITAVVLIVGIRGCSGRASMIENVRDNLDVKVFQKAVDEMEHTEDCCPCPPGCDGKPCC